MTISSAARANPWGSHYRIEAEAAPIVRDAKPAVGSFFDEVVPPAQSDAVGDTDDTDARGKLDVYEEPDCFGILRKPPGA
jgi:hypothetical protein